MPTQRRHSMPFGAEPQAAGGVRFRLWAPGAARVDLCLAGRADPLAMAPADDGWYELVSGEAGPGSRYRYRIDGCISVPDPASRCQSEDVHGDSEVVDPAAWAWRDEAWRGRPWHEAVIYELHVGSFTAQGTFAGVMERLDHLARLGVTAIELMPIADFPGARNWGYDGVLPYAPDRRYGRPEDLKALIEAAHARGIMMLLDVVYNHFGPEGNYLHVYAPQFFSERHRTPWGAAINFDGPQARTVRDFFIHNALYWLDEYHFDGLRLDAVHAIADSSLPHILVELAEAVHDGSRRERHIHLVLENDGNEARYLARDDGHDIHDPGRAPFYAAQWNDDLHHALHVLITGERSGYYADHAQAPAASLGRCLTEGFDYQGQNSRYRGHARGEPSTHLPPTAFVGFLQNHDQIGNRAFGERLGQLAPSEAIDVASAVLLLAPSPPLLFMGQEWCAEEPFLFFCDFEAKLAPKVRDGRRAEFARFPEFAKAAARDAIPDPTAPETFARCVLDWRALDTQRAQGWLELHRTLLALRAREIVPRLAHAIGKQAGFALLGRRALHAHWRLGAATLGLWTSFEDVDTSLPEPPRGRLLWAMPGTDAALRRGVMPAWCAAWYLDETAGAQARAAAKAAELEEL